MRKALIYLAGWFSLLLGLIGLLFPAIPGVALLTVAAGCFARTSPRMHDAMGRMPIVGRWLEDLEAGRGLEPEVKAFSILAIVGSVIWALAFAVKETTLRVLLVLLAAGAVLQVLMLPAARRRTAPVLQRTR